MNRRSTAPRGPGPVRPGRPAPIETTARTRSGDPAARPGRGTGDRMEGRFQTHRRATLDGDVWWASEPETAAVQTRLTPDHARTIITRNQSPDVPFDRSINAYQGCEHGCIYCFARPTHAWYERSPGLDFETDLFFKPTAPELLRAALARPRYRCRPIAMGTNTDPWQPAERRLELTRQLLEVMLETRHPVTLVTKSSLILRDLDLLAALAERNLVHASISVTTLDDTLKRRLEPRTASPPARLRTIATLADAGVPVGVMAAPIIPALNDCELESILTAASAAGARRAGYILLRLPHEVAPLFKDWLDTHYPERREHVLSILRQCRDGALYRAGWGQRMRGSGVFAELLEKRFRSATKRLGLDSSHSHSTWPELDCDAFIPPPPASAEAAEPPVQAALF